MSNSFMRGHVYRVEYGTLGRKPFAIVSNNTRNRKLDSVLAARVTTTDKSGISTAVKLAHNDPLVGYILADDIRELWDDELESGTYLGTLTPNTIIKLNRALSEALGIP